MFFRQLYTIYERLIKARQIIEAKVDEELKLKNDEKLNGLSAQIKAEKFDIFVGGVLAAIHTAIDTNKYEDFAR